MLSQHSIHRIYRSRPQYEAMAFLDCAYSFISHLRCTQKRMYSIMSILWHMVRFLLLGSFISDHELSLKPGKLAWKMNSCISR